MQQAVTPFALDALTWSARLLALASQIQMYFWLRERLSDWGKTPVRLTAGTATALGLTAVLSSELFSLGWRGYVEQAGIGHLLAACYAVGSLGSYCLWLAWQFIEGYRGRPAAPAPDPADAGRRLLLAGAARTALAAPFAVAGYGTFIGRSDLDVREIDVSIRDLHPDLEGLRIAQLTDIHAGPYLTPRRLESVVALANETKPHITVITGDVITTHDDPLDPAIEALGKLRAEAGVFGCMGNHEHYARAEGRLVQYGARHGLDFLRAQNRELQFGAAALNLVGVDYQRKGRPYLTDAEPLRRPSQVNLLLSHNPDVFPRAAELGYDLVISGHTHGGQITVEILEQTLNPGRFYTPFVAGKYEIADSTIYVSRGIGTINVPMRIGALPEIALLRLRRA